MHRKENQSEFLLYDTVFTCRREIFPVTRDRVTGFLVYVVSLSTAIGIEGKALAIRINLSFILTE